MNKARCQVLTLINTLDLEQAKQTARVAVECGSDWVGIGAPLMYSCGFLRAMPAIREVVGGLPIVADMKVHDGGAYFASLVKEHGADYCTVSTRKNYGCCREAVRAHHACGVGIIGDLCTVPENEIPHYVAELQNIGVQAVCVHYTVDESNYYSMFRRPWDGVRAAKGVATIPVGCVVRSLRDVTHALDEGADWIAVTDAIVDYDADGGYRDLEQAIAATHTYPAAPQPSRG